MKRKRTYVSDQILSAFLDLLAEKDYINITVTDIIRKAGVSRASFYRHYKAIGDIPDSIVRKCAQSMQDNFLPVLQHADGTSLRAFLTDYTYANMLIHDRLTTFLPSNVAMLFSRLSAYFQNCVLPDNDLSGEERFRMSAKSGIIHGILMQWIADGKRETAEQISDRIMQYITLF